MSPIYVPGKLTLRQTYVGVDDPDAANYIAAVEAADEIASPGIGGLETATKVAIHSFVKGCKADGIWPAIKASCILAGARTLDGALVPLVGTAPTSFNFVAGDYNRETGLKGDGSTKYLDSNRANNADPQNNNHNTTYITDAGTGGVISGGNVSAANNIYDIGSTVYFRNRTNSFESKSESNVTGFAGHSRSNASNYGIRINGTSSTASQASLAPVSDNVVLYQRGGTVFSTHRLSFYSIGEALDLAALDGRVTDLMTAFAAAIP